METLANIPLLSAITYSPLIGVLIILFIPKTRQSLIRNIAIVASFFPLLILIPIIRNFNFENAGIQLIEKAEWIPTWGISYLLGIDGLSVTLVALTAILGFLSILASAEIKHRVKEYYIFILVLISAVFGVFVSLDFILFYLFWEAVLIPMYFLIGIWGGPRRKYAAFKFFIYTLLGSVLMFIGMLVIYFAAGAHTFNIIALYGVELAPLLRNSVFLALFISFAIKVPIFPFHTWLPDAHVQAPTAVSVLLAGVLLKMGIYGFLRLSLPLLPEAFEYFIPLFFWLAIINIIYGASLAMAQSDLKRLVAYSSISHMGFILLGVAAANEISINGAIIQMFAHGTITGMLFLLVGMYYQRTHTRDLSELGGLYNQIPVLGGILSFTALASLGLPGLSGFVGEFLILIGSFDRFGFLIAFAAIGVLLNAAYLLRMVFKTLMGKELVKYSKLTDISIREVIILTPLVMIIVFMGVAPDAFFKFTTVTVNGFVRMIMGG
ncbi:MAG: NADH-quinone oxidoreductase subunit M [Actinomycetia bacterium]|nr:NADH-quinone oxidoreductase subunit M [Actinomycetes bacterium]